MLPHVEDTFIAVTKKKGFSWNRGIEVLCVVSVKRDREKENTYKGGLVGIG